MVLAQVAAVDEAPFSQNPTPHEVELPGSLQVAAFVPSQNPPQALEPGHAGLPPRGAPPTGRQLPTLPA